MISLLLFPALAFAVLLSYCLVFVRALRLRFQARSVNVFLLITGGLLLLFLGPMGVFILGDLLIHDGRDTANKGIAYFFALLPFVLLGSYGYAIWRMVRAKRDTMRQRMDEVF